MAADFIVRFGTAVEALTVGGAETGADIGPLISRQAVARITAAVDSAVRCGARVSHVGPIPDLPGGSYPPTVLVDVDPVEPLVRHEIFGPVAPVMTWTDEAEFLRLVNNTQYGLAAYVFSGELGRAVRLAEKVEAGMVGINRGVVSDPSAPVGGVKESGLGREGARDGLRECQEAQFLAVDWPGR